MTVSSLEIVVISKIMAIVGCGNSVRVLSALIFLFINVNYVFCNSFVNELMTSEHRHEHCNHQHPKEDQVSANHCFFFHKSGYVKAVCNVRTQNKLFVS